MNYNKPHHQHQPVKKQDAFQHDHNGPLALEEKSKSAFIAALSAIGFALGFFFLPLISPDGSDPAKREAISHIFSMVGFCLLGYALLMMLGMAILRSNVKFARMALNWFYLPAVALNYMNELYTVLGGK